MISPKLPSFREEKKLWKKGFKVVIGVDEVGRGSWAGPVVAAAVAFGVGRLPHMAKDVRRPLMKDSKLISSSLKERRPPKTRDNLERIYRPAFYSFASGQPPRHYLSLIENLGINDSKALRSQKRSQLAEKIKECSLSWAIGEVKVGVINRVGIGKATTMAMRKALRQVQDEFPNVKTFVLVDGFHIRYLRGLGLRNQKAIIGGDKKSISCAAASILAKVYRDNLMKKLVREHPQYRWGKNKQSLFRAKGRDIYGWARNKGYGTREHQEAILKHGITRLHRKKFVETFLGKIGAETN